MYSDQSVKVCPLCAEPIKAAAKVCPFCRAPQTRLAHWRPYLGLGFSAFALLAFVGLACVWLFPDVFRSEGRSFAPVGGEFVFKRRSVIGISRGSPFANVRIIGLLTKTRVGESKRNPDASTEPTWPIQF